MEYDAEKILKKPYLLIGKAAGFKGESIRSILKDVPIVHVDHNKKHEFIVYFDSISDMEDSYRKLEKMKYNFSIEVGRRNEIEDEPKEEYPVESSEILSNGIAINLRHFIVSENNQLPKLKRKPLVPFSKYFENGSLLRRHDPIMRYFQACDEHVLERYGIFKMALITKPNCTFEFRNGRIIKRYIDDDMQNFEPVQTDEQVAKIMMENGYKQCYACGQFCMPFCCKCKTPFCGEICAQNMQQEHDVACSKKLTLTYKPKPIMNELKDQFLVDQMPRSGSKVQITAFLQSNVICVRSLNKHENNDYLAILDEVQSEAKHAEKFTGELKCGQLVLLKVDKEFLRAMVLHVENENAVNLICVDYGNLEIQPIDNLYEISKSLAGLARYVQNVQLIDVPLCFMHANYRKMLYYLLNQIQFIIEYDAKNFDMDTKLYQVNLFFVDKQNESVNKRLVGLSKAIVPNTKTKGNFHHMLEQVTIKTGKTVQLFVMDNFFIDKGAICCTLPEFTHEIVKFQKEFNSYAESLTTVSSYTPRVDELCIAKYLNIWCRGRCLEIVGDGFPTVLFLDFGNVAHISCDNIRPYPDVFIGYPLLSFDVELVDLPKDCDDDLIGKLKNELPIGEIITCDLSYDKNDKFYFMKMPKTQ